MTVISQDDHLTVGAWAACGYICSFQFLWCRDERRCLGFFFYPEIH